MSPTNVPQLPPPHLRVRHFPWQRPRRCRNCGAALGDRRTREVHVRVPDSPQRIRHMSAHVCRRCIGVGESSQEVSNVR